MNRFAFATLAVLVSSPVAATTIPLSLSESRFGLPDFYTLSTSFTLPVDFTNSVFSISSFSADDRAVLKLNGTIVASTGIFGPGTGSMVLTSGGPNDPFTFASGGGPFPDVTSGFIAGLNTLFVIVNDTNTGIFGSLSGGFNSGFPNNEAPTSLTLTGVVSYDVAAVPLPAAGALMLGGLGALGLLARRGKRRAAAA